MDSGEIAFRYLAGLPCKVCGTLGTRRRSLTVSVILRLPLVCKGEHWGPPFHDGDMYKWMEGVASVYAVNKDPELDKLMDNFITCVVKAQRADGYIHTPVVIEELNKGIDSHALGDQHKQTVIGTKVGDENEKGAFANRLNFETYNPTPDDGGYCASPCHRKDYSLMLL